MGNTPENPLLSQFDDKEAGLRLLVNTAKELKELWRQVIERGNAPETLHFLAEELRFIHAGFEDAMRKNTFGKMEAAGIDVTDLRDGFAYTVFQNLCGVTGRDVCASPASMRTLISVAESFHTQVDAADKYAQKAVEALLAMAQGKGKEGPTR